MAAVSCSNFTFPPLPGNPVFVNPSGASNAWTWLFGIPPTPGFIYEVGAYILSGMFYLLELFVFTFIYFIGSIFVGVGCGIGAAILYPFQSGGLVAQVISNMVNGLSSYGVGAAAVATIIVLVTLTLLLAVVYVGFKLGRGEYDRIEGLSPGVESLTPPSIGESGEESGEEASVEDLAVVA